MCIYDGFNLFGHKNKDECCGVVEYELFIRSFLLCMHLHHEACDVLLLMSTQLCSYESMMDNGWIMALNATVQNRGLET